MTETILTIAGDYSLISEGENVFIRKVITRAGDKVRGLIARWNEVQDTSALDNTADIIALPSDGLEEALEETYDLWTISALACDECGYLTDDAYIRSHGNYCSASCAGMRL